MIMKKYKFLEHTADIKFQVYGSSLNEIFENTALAISEILARDEKIKIKTKKKIAVEGKDLESLLYNFIEELLFFLDAKNFVIAKAKLKVDKKKLGAGKPRLWLMFEGQPILTRLSVSL